MDSFQQLLGIAKSSLPLVNKPKLILPRVVPQYCDIQAIHPPPVSQRNSDRGIKAPRPPRRLFFRVPQPGEAPVAAGGGGGGAA